MLHVSCYMLCTYCIDPRGLVKWYHSGLQNRCRGFDSHSPCQEKAYGFARVLSLVGCGNRTGWSELGFFSRESRSEWPLNCLWQLRATPDNEAALQSSEATNSHSPCQKLCVPEKVHAAFGICRGNRRARFANKPENAILKPIKHLYYGFPW